MSWDAILFLEQKEIFPNEDATRFDLIEELYVMPAKVPINMHQFATGKPLQANDSLFMTEWMAIFWENGLRDDVTVCCLQDACLKLVVRRALEPANCK